MTKPDPVTVTYRQTAMTLLKGHWILHARRLLIALVIFLAATALIVAAEWGEKDAGVMLGLLGLAWLLVLHAYVSRPWLAYRAHLKEPNMAGELKVTFGDDCVRAENGAIRSKYEWSAFTKFIEGRDLFVLRIGRRHTMVVPKSAFETAEDIARFRELTASNIAPAR